MKFSPDGESEIIRVADSEIVPVGTVKLPPHGGGSDEEWQPQGLRKGNTLPPGERENFLPAVFIVVRGRRLCLRESTLLRAWDAVCAELF